MCALRSSALGSRLGIAVGLGDGDKISGFNNTALDALKGSEERKTLARRLRVQGRGGDLETIAACWRQQQQHDVAHLLYVNLALTDTHCLD